MSKPRSGRRAAVAPLRAVALAKKSSYREKASALRALGFDVAYGKKGGNLPQRKAAITRKIKTLATFLSPKNRFVFVESSPHEAKKFGPALGKTPKGFFVQVPQNVPISRFRAKIKDGDLEIVARGKYRGKTKREKTGKFRRDIIAKLDAAKLAADPLGAVRAALRGRGKKARKKPSHVFVMVNGHQGKTQYLPREFQRYFAAKIEEMLKRKGKKKMSAREIADFFHIKMVYDGLNREEREEVREYEDEDEDGESEE